MADETENQGGRFIQRGPDGKIERAGLDPETARQMVAARWERERQPKKERIDSLLASRGIDPAAADEGLRTLAELAVSQRSGSVTAMKYLDRLCGLDRAEPEGGGHSVQFIDEPGRVYLVLDGINLYQRMSGEQAGELLAMLRELKTGGKNPRENASPNTENRAEHGDNGDLHARIEAAEEAKAERAESYRRPID